MNKNGIKGVRKSKTFWVELKLVHCTEMASLNKKSKKSFFNAYCNRKSNKWAGFHDFFFFYLLSKLWNIRHGIKEMENKRSENEKEVFGFKIGIKNAYFCAFDK